MNHPEDLLDLVSWVIWFHEQTLAKCFVGSVVCLTLVVGGDEAQDVLVAEHDGLVDLGLTEPGAFISGGEDFDGHILATPLPPPHLAKAPFANALLKDDGASYGPLNQQRQTWPPGIITTH